MSDRAEAHGHTHWSVEQLVLGVERLALHLLLAIWVVGLHDLDQSFGQWAWVKQLRDVRDRKVTAASNVDLVRGLEVTATQVTIQCHAAITRWLIDFPEPAL